MYCLVVAFVWDLGRPPERRIDEKDFVNSLPTIPRASVREVLCDDWRPVMHR
jgi:hypothetical protein